MARRQRDDEFAMDRRQRGCGHDEAAIRGARIRGDVAFNLTRVTHIDGAHLKTERRCRSLDCTPLTDTGGYPRIAEDRRARHTWLDLLEQLQPFSAQPIVKLHKAGSIATGSRQAL